MRNDFYLNRGYRIHYWTLYDSGGRMSSIITQAITQSRLQIDDLKLPIKACKDRLKSLRTELKIIKLLLTYVEDETQLRWLQKQENDVDFDIQANKNKLAGYQGQVKFHKELIARIKDLD